jgi:hypothetical protein
MIGDPNSNRVVVQPHRITDLPSDGAKPKQIKMQFQAPPEVNSYHFEAYWISDTYLGSNITESVTVSIDSAVLMIDRPHLHCETSPVTAPDRLDR